MRSERRLRRVLTARSGWSRLVRGDSGQELVELALGLPVLFLLIFGFINFALVLFGLCNATYACRAAVRFACVHSTTSFAPATSATLNAMVLPFIFQYPQNTYTVTLAPGSSGNPVGSTATVTVGLNYTINLPGYTYNGLQLKTSASGVVVQ